MASDTAFLNRLLIACSRGPVRLFRNSVGLGWVGKSTRFTSAATVQVQPGDVLIRRARPLHAGLCEGSADLIGWESREIREEHVGQTWAVFVSVEAKEGTGRLSAVQKAWFAAVDRAGGVAIEARDVESVQERLFHK